MITVVVPPVKFPGTSDIIVRSSGDAEAAQWTPRSCKAFRSSEGMTKLAPLSCQRTSFNTLTRRNSKLRVYDYDRKGRPSDVKDVMNPA